MVSDVYERYRGRVSFLSLDVRDDRGTVRDLIRERGWRMPVGFDRDGAVAGLYRVGGCPTFAYVYPGGTLQSASIGELTPAQLGLQGRRAAAATRAAERAEMAARRQRIGSTGSRPSRAGSPRTSPPSSPASASPRSASTAGPARARSRSAAGCASSPTASTASHAIHMRERPIPWAYRVFFRQIGLDPDRTRTPVEQLALERLHDGAFKSRGLPDDALTIAIVETGVALRAFDGGAGRAASASATPRPGESLPGRPGELAQGTLVIADERGPVGLLFGATAEWSGDRAASPAADDRRDPGQRGAADRGRRGALDGRGADRALSGS